MVPDRIFDQLFRLRWPEAFVVEYRDGEMEYLLRGEGINFLLPEDDPAGIGHFAADIPKRSRHQQRQHGRAVSFRDLRALYSTEGETLWKRY